MIIRKVKVTEYEYQAPINYVAGATEPDIQFQLTDYEIPSGATGRVYVGRSDGTFEYTVATISGNNVTVAPTSSMFSVKGPGAIQVTLYVGNEVVKNFAIPVYVHADLADDSAEAGSDVTGVFRAAEEQALADFQEQAEEIVQQVIESIPADYTELTEEVDELNERIDDIVPGLSEDAKTALLACFQHIAFLDNDDDYYTNLRNALYASDELVSITATFSQGSTIIYPDEPLDNLRTMLVVTGLYADGNTKVINDYRLSGTLVGDTLSVITVSYRDKTTTFAVAVTEYEWGSDYTWLYRADKDGLLSSNSNISEVGAVSGNAPAVETNSGGVLNIKSEYDGTDHGSIFELIPHTSTNASIKLKARFNELPIGAEGSGLRVQVSNGTNGAQFYVMQRTSNAPKIFSRSNVSAVDIANIELNKWYILECELSSGQQVITVDGTAYPVANLSSASNTKTRIIALEPSNAVSQNPGNLDFDIAWIAFKDNSN